MTKDKRMAKSVADAVTELQLAYENLQHEIEDAIEHGLEARVVLRLTGQGLGHRAARAAREDRPTGLVQGVGPRTGLDAKVSVVRRLA